MRALPILCFAVAFSPFVARADGLIYNLPKDGAKAVYTFKAIHNDKSSGSERKFDGTLTIASVGTATVDGNKCRWIEIRMTMNFGEKVRNNTAKLLITESDIGKGKLMIANVKRGWEKMGKGDARSLNDPLKRRGHPVPAFLPDPLAEVKKLKPAEVETGLGKLKCAGLTGKTIYEQGDDTRTDKFEAEYTIRLSDKSPFGVASCKIHLKEFVDKTKLDDTIEITFTLKSVGKNAKSALPDKK